MTTPPPPERQSEAQDGGPAFPQEVTAPENRTRVLKCYRCGYEEECPAWGSERPVLCDDCEEQDALSARGETK